jgi:hypothetical protein
MYMPTFLLLLTVLAGRLLLALVRGLAYLLLLPARTAMAVAPHMARPRWVLLGGATASLALAAAAALLVGGVQ